MTSSEHGEMLTAAQAAERLETSVWVIYRLCKKRRLPHKHVGGRIQIPAGPLAEYERAHTYGVEETEAA